MEEQQKSQNKIHNLVITATPSNRNRNFTGSTTTQHQPMKTPSSNKDFRRHSREGSNLYTPGSRGLKIGFDSSSHRRQSKRLNSAVGAQRFFSKSQMRIQEQQKQRLQSKLEQITDCKGFDIPFFMRGDSKVDVEFDQINKLLNIVDMSKKNILKNADRLPEYDPKVNQKISLQTVKQRIHVINPQFNVSQINNLFPQKGEISALELQEFLKSNEITDAEFPEGDPMTLALKLFLDDNGNLNFQQVSNSMEQLGYGKLDKKDVDILKEFMDVDEDGQISGGDLTQFFTPENLQFLSRESESQNKKNNIASKFSNRFQKNSAFM